MSLSSEEMRKLLEAGATGEQLAVIAEIIEKREASNIERKQKERDRKRRFRSKERDRDGTETGQSGDKDGQGHQNPPPPPNPPLEPPLTPTPTRENTTRTRGEVFTLPAWIPAEPWESFMEVRKKAKAADTVNAKKLLVKELERLRNLGHDPTQLIEKSIRNSWKDIYEPKQENQGGSQNVRRYENQPTKFERGVAAAMRGLDTA